MHSNSTLQTIARLAAVGAAALAAACGGNNARPSCDTTENANMRVEATDRLNPDEDGRPLPTKVRIYQLANIGTMETATFEDIWENDEETLGDAFLGKDELWIYPESRINRQFERNPDANYIVGVAIVRRPTGVSWRTILELPPPAGEAQCADLQENPDQAPEEQPNVYLAFELDDYQIEGAIRLEYPPPPCAENDPICAAERAAQDAASDVADQAGGAAEGAQGAGESAAQGAADSAASNLPSTPNLPSAPTP